jgi:UDP-glucose 4-epimerase
MKALIFGANGYIGMHIAMQAQKENWDVSLFDVQENGQNWFAHYQFVDVRKKESIEAINTNVDFIFFFSGLTGTLNAYEQYENFIDVNEKGLLHLLQHMRIQNSRARIIFPSTRLVYKGKKNVPLTEDSEKECKTIYALNKFTCEHLLQQYSEYFGIQYTIFRICVPYGNEISNNYSYGTIGFFLKKATAGNNISLYGSGEQRRTFTHISDLTNAMFQVISLPDSVNQIYNTGGENFSLKQVAELIGQKYHIGIELAPWPPLEKLIESGDTIFDAGKIGKLTGKNLFTKKLQEWINHL